MRKSASSASRVASLLGATRRSLTKISISCPLKRNFPSRRGSSSRRRQADSAERAACARRLLIAAVNRGLAVVANSQAVVGIVDAIVSFVSDQHDSRTRRNVRVIGNVDQEFVPALAFQSRSEIRESAARGRASAGFWRRSFTLTCWSVMVRYSFCLTFRASTRRGFCSARLQAGTHGSPVTRRPAGCQPEGWRYISRVRQARELKCDCSNCAPRQ